MLPLPFLIFHFQSAMFLCAQGLVLWVIVCSEYWQRHPQNACPGMDGLVRICEEFGSDEYRSGDRQCPPPSDKQLSD